MFGYFGGMGASGLLLMLGFWGAFLALVVWAVTRLFPSQPRRDAVELPDRRFAAGDIDAETDRSVTSLSALAGSEQDLCNEGSERCARKHPGAIDDDTDSHAHAHQRPTGR
jgi:hypothetical protein